MKNNTPLLALLLLAGTCLVACGGGGAKADGGADSTAVAVSEPAGPKPSEQPVTHHYDTNVGSHSYSRSVARSVDSIASTVSDDFDQTYYDNVVVVNISRDGQPFFSHTFRKDTFADYLDDNQKQTMVLLGMAYDQSMSGGSRLSLTARVGEPCVGEGPAFLIEVPLSGGAFSIVRDTRVADEVDAYVTQDDSLSRQ